LCGIGKKNIVHDRSQTHDNARHAAAAACAVISMSISASMPERAPHSRVERRFGADRAARLFEETNRQVN
jgi:hypothetical protein